MSKVNLQTLANLENPSVGAVNNNFTKIQEALDNTVSRDGSQPNRFMADLDLDGHNILNVHTISAVNFDLDGVDFEALLNEAEQWANQSEQFALVAGFEANRSTNAKEAAEAARDEAVEAAGDAVSQGEVPIRNSLTSAASQPVRDGISKIIVMGPDGGYYTDVDNGTPVAFTSTLGENSTPRPWYRELDVNEDRFTPAVQAIPKSYVTRVVDVNSLNVSNYQPASNIDGVSLVLGDLVLRATPTGHALDGIYVVTATGGIRHPFLRVFNNLSGLHIRVVGGTLAHTTWYVNSPFGGTIDSTPLLIEELVSKTSDGVPIGAVLFDPAGIGWPGYLEANGSSFDPSVYPDLAALYPLGVLPDFTDRVPRGAGPLAGDAGTVQSDAMQRITGEVGPAGVIRAMAHPDTSTGALAPKLPLGSYTQIAAGSGSTAGTSSTIEFDSGNSPGARVSDDETRVKAVIGKFYIKAYDAFINEGDVDLVAIEQAQAWMLRFDAQVLTPLQQAQVHANLDTGAEVGKLALGIGQTWQDVSASRATETAYQNTTGKPIQVAARITIGSGTRDFQVSADNSTWVQVGIFFSSAAEFQSFIVPAGWYYRIAGGGSTGVFWAELR